MGVGAGMATCWIGVGQEEAQSQMTTRPSVPCEGQLISQQLVDCCSYLGNDACATRMTSAARDAAVSAAIWVIVVTLSLLISLLMPSAKTL